MMSFVSFALVLAVGFRPIDVIDEWIEFVQFPAIDQVLFDVVEHFAVGSLESFRIQTTLGANQYRAFSRAFPWHRLSTWVAIQYLYQDQFSLL